jgi:hypothetical protein
MTSDWWYGTNGKRSRLGFLSLKVSLMSRLMERLGHIDVTYM